MKNLWKYGTMVIAIVFVLISCDTDPTELGSSFLGVDIDNTIIEEEFDVTAFSTSLNPVQTNNFPSVQLGVYNDPVYGKTTYDFVTQLSLNNTGVDFGENRVLDSVVLSIPYYSQTESITGEEREYSLDSVYGPGTIDFKIYRNRYFLNSFDPNNVEQAAAYFSDFGPVIDANKGEEIELEFEQDGDFVQGVDVTGFRPDDSQIILTEVNEEGAKEETERIAPEYRQRLETSYWKDLIIDNGNAAYLTSDSNFQNFYRGLYFKVTGSTDGGVLSYLNLTNARIVLYYTSDLIDRNDSDGDGSTTDILQEGLSSSYIINLQGTRVNLLQTEVPVEVQTRIADSFDEENGAERLFIKGGPGAMTFVDLFGPDLDNDGEADQLTEFLRKNVIINEANLEFYVSQEDVEGGDTEPERIFIYDFETSTVLGDFSISGSGITANTNHLGRLQRDETTGEGVKYRIRLTRHIEDIISGERENNRLGLFVSQNVALIGASRVKDQSQPLSIERIPISSAISHEGTVLHGNRSQDLDKRLRFKIFYTEID